jgi:hypothetical protein
MKTKEWKLRAECLGDVVNFINAAISKCSDDNPFIGDGGWCGYKIYNSGNGCPDCELVYNTSEPDGFHSVMATIIGGHVMAQTMAPTEYFDGNRLYNTNEQIARMRGMAAFI